MLERDREQMTIVAPSAASNLAQAPYAFGASRHQCDLAFKAEIHVHSFPTATAPILSMLAPFLKSRSHFVVGLSGVQIMRPSSRFLVRGPTAVDDHGRPRHERGCIGRQEDNRPGYVVDVTDAAQLYFG